MVLWWQRWLSFISQIHEWKVYKLILEEGKGAFYTGSNKTILAAGVQGNEYKGSRLQKVASFVYCPGHCQMDLSQ